nr:techylectin-5B-like [Leptinotarsa decemlineata]
MTDTSSVPDALLTLSCFRIRLTIDGVENELRTILYNSKYINKIIEYYLFCRYAQYSHFKIYSEADYYKLEIDGYEGNAGDSLNDPWYGSNNSPFSTYNRDNDRSSLNCASMLKGGWWWKSCGRGLNGLYLNDPQDLTARQGIVWFRWKGWDYTLKKSVMMIKPRSFVGGT